MRDAKPHHPNTQGQSTFSKGQQQPAAGTVSTEVAEDFAHPASVEPQQIVWIPRDPLGLGPAEASANVAHGVQVSMEGAAMDGKGRVDVDRTPPGMTVP